jgi:hypothetical protein
MFVAISYYGVVLALGIAENHHDVVFGILSHLFPASIVNFLRTQLFAKTDEVRSKIETGVKAKSHKTQRSFFLSVHLLIVSFVIGVSLSTGPSGGVVCQAANVLSIVFRKPFLPSLLYCLNYLVDSNGWLLWLNPYTDSLVAVMMLLALLWLLVAFIFSCPILLCFPFLTLIFFLPTFVYFKTWGHMMLFTPETSNVDSDGDSRHNGMKNPEHVKKPEVDEWEDGWDENKARSALGAQVIFKRLIIYSTLTALVFGCALMPLYQGSGYEQVLKSAAGHFSVGLRFWRPSFRLSFRWPDISFPSQV